MQQLHRSKTANAECRKQDDGYNNKKPNDANYFKKQYQDKTKQRRVCDTCGFNISWKSIKLGKAQENEEVPQMNSL